MKIHTKQCILQNNHFRKRYWGHSPPPCLPKLLRHCNVICVCSLFSYPYDDTRVKLSQRPGVEGSDYINANYIDSYGCKDSFIATQAPLESTIGDFWRMIWEQNCGTIVMLSKEFEGQQVCEYILFLSNLILQRFGSLPF